MTHFDTRQEDLSNAVRVYLNGEGNLRNQEGTPRKKTPVHLDGQVTFWPNKMKVNLLARWNGTPLEDGMETLVLRAEENRWRINRTSRNPRQPLRKQTTRHKKELDFYFGDAGQQDQKKERRSLPNDLVKSLGRGFYAGTGT